MKAIILASGTGSRLLPLTENTPKCLIDINGKTVLGLQLNLLQTAGINDVIITTGPFKEKIEDFIARFFPSMNITCVYNERFDSTNYIYSMYKCQAFINDDFLLMHGDLVFNAALLRGLLEQKTNAVLMSRTMPLPQKDFKGLLCDNRVQKISVDIFDEHAYFLAPLYKLSQESFQRWMDKIITFVDSGNISCYAEDAFNLISDTMGLQPYFIKEHFCKELDTFEDLAVIKNALYSNKI